MDTLLFKLKVESPAELLFSLLGGALLCCSDCSERGGAVSGAVFLGPCGGCFRLGVFPPCSPGWGDLSALWTWLLVWRAWSCPGVDGGSELAPGIGAALTSWALVRAFFCLLSFCFCPRAVAVGEFGLDLVPSSGEGERVKPLAKRDP
jgi:hypothetical protein